MCKPGIKGETFKIILDSNFNVDTILSDGNTQRQLIVTSEPKHIYSKWHHKLLNRLTFGKRFCEGYEHTVISKPIEYKMGLY